MNDSHSPHLPQLSQLAGSPESEIIDQSQNRARVGGTQTKAKSLTQHSSRSRSRRRSSQASSMFSKEDNEDDELQRSTSVAFATAHSSAEPIKLDSSVTQNGDLDYNGKLHIEADGKEQRDDDEEEDDLIAIPGEHSLLRGEREDDDGPSYRQVDGPGLSSGRGLDRATMIRKIIVNLALIGSWFFFSTLMNLYNSWLFSKKRHNFSYPLFVTSIHMLVQFGLSSLLMCACRRNRRVVPRKSNGKRARPEARDWALKVVPCALATALDIGLSNLSLKTITLTFYTMCKSSNLAFVLLFAILFKLEKLRLSLVGIITLITIGVIMMVAAETKFVLEGAIQVLTASAMGGLRWALTQMLLHKSQMGMDNPIATIFWLSPLMSFFMVMSSMLLEDWRAMFSSQFFQDFASSMKSIALMVAPGFIAFLMNLSEFALIQRTSVMTLSVAGIFKEIATILISSSVFGDELTPINVTGLCIALAGIGLYNYLKYRLMMRNNFQQRDTSNLLTSSTNNEINGTEMGGTNLPPTGLGGSYTSLSREDTQVEMEGDVIELTKEELERRKRRDEEADMIGWSHSGTIRTGDGYDDDHSNSSSSSNSNNSNSGDLTPR
ncbi:hypothetical protein CBS101457_003674 [Exobasidium rhododendri]|nr:hypothetical protein CBS101457_003674 [Exobasidium rhododendri]